MIINHSIFTIQKKYMLAEMSYTEIAKKTGRELKSVDNSIQRIKKKLKTFIEEYEKN